MPQKIMEVTDDMWLLIHALKMQQCVSLWEDKLTNRKDTSALIQYKDGILPV